jgi:hypothetical protein
MADRKFRSGGGIVATRQTRLLSLASFSSRGVPTFGCRLRLGIGHCSGPSSNDGSGSAAVRCRLHNYSANNRLAPGLLIFGVELNA